MSEFEGQKVAKVVNKIAGPIGDDRLNEALSPDDDVVVVVSGRVAGVSHDAKDDGLVRIQKIKVAHGYIVPGGVDADDLIQRLRKERQDELKKLLGTNRLGLEDGE
jgi:hypothetical protein